jgi:hypothetical protein
MFKVRQLVAFLSINEIAVRLERCQGSLASLPARPEAGLFVADVELIPGMTHFGWLCV